MSNTTRSNYLWNMTGSIASALVSTFLLLLASRNLDSSQSDMLSITYSLSQQLFIIGLFQVRNFQATDTTEAFSFATYFWARLVTVFLMLLSTFAFSIFSGFSTEKVIVLILIVLTRALDAFSDVFQGYYQQHQLSWISGKILFFRSLATISTFGVFVAISRSLLIATGAMFLVGLIITAFLEGPHLDKKLLTPQPKEVTFNIVPLLKYCFPLFLNGFLVTYIFTEPKLVIDHLIAIKHLGAGMQRDFNILFMPTFVLNLLFAMLRPLITDLSYQWSEGRKREFFKQILLVSAFLVGIGGVGMVLAYSIGTPILSAIFGVDLSAYRWELTLLIAAGIFNVLATMIDNLVTIFRKQSYLLIIYVATFAISKLITKPFILQNGMTGAASSFLLIMFLYFVFSLIVFGLLLLQLDASKHN